MARQFLFTRARQSRAKGEDEATASSTTRALAKGGNEATASLTTTFYYGFAKQFRKNKKRN